VGAVQFWSLRTYSLWRASEMTLHCTCPPHRRKLAHSMHMHSCLKRLQLSRAARAWTIWLGHLESIQNSLVAVDSSTGGILFCFLLGIFVCSQSWQSSICICSEFPKAVANCLCIIVECCPELFWETLLRHISGVYIVSDRVRFSPWRITVLAWRRRCSWSCVVIFLIFIPTSWGASCGMLFAAC
jgi:hypothetical protein